MCIENIPTKVPTDVTVKFLTWVYKESHHEELLMRSLESVRFVVLSFEIRSAYRALRCQSYLTLLAHLLGITLMASKYRTNALLFDFW